MQFTVKPEFVGTCYSLLGVSHRHNGLLDRCAYATLTFMAAVVASGQLEKQTLEEATLRRTFHYRYVTHTRSGLFKLWP
jgi:hypothetical protein